MKSRRALVVLIAVASIAGSLGVTTWLAVGMVTGLSTIDPPTELANELALLQAMPAGCELEYGRNHVRRSQADIHETVWIKACGERWLAERIAVPRVGESLHFQLSRDGVGEPWTVQVDTESAPRSDLIAAIRTFTPRIVEVGPKLLSTAAAEMAQARAQREAEERAAAGARDENANSYR